jgi:heme exporter protein D
VTMDLGPHAFFIIAAYGAAAVVVAALIGRAVLDHRAQVKALAELEARGARRRSAVPAARTAAETSTQAAGASPS